MKLRSLVSAFSASLAASSALALALAAPAFAEESMPHYDHVFIIVAENKGHDQIMSHPEWTPRIHKLAAEYGLADQFYAEVHASEANYIAMIGGDTFGIHDDDAFYCKAGPRSEFCEKSTENGYADHNVTARSLLDQMAEKGLTWKAYVEDIPAAGSLVPRWPTAAYPVAGMANDLYAAKHNGFVNFQVVNTAPPTALQTRLVGFRQLDADLASGDLPAYAHIVPNQCNEMHGLHRAEDANVPADCDDDIDLGALIKRGDTEIGMLVDKVMASKAWSAPGNFAIVVTFDENNKEERKTGAQGCCGYDPSSKANFGGGHIVTVVITNHGPRHLIDPTPYNHYSLLRTTEAAFGFNEYLGHAADTDKGVVTMTPLFAVAATTSPSPATPEPAAQSGSSPTATPIAAPVGPEAALPAYAIAQTIPIGAPEKWDFLEFDPSANRVFVSHRTKVDVVDLAAGKVSGTIDGIGESHDVTIVPELGRGYADDAATKSVTVFDLKTLTKVGAATSDTDADAMIFDPASKRVFVMNGDGNSVTAIDAASNQTLGTTPLGGSPEMAAADGHGKLFINVASTNEVVALDTATMTLTQRWSVPACVKPHGLAIDREAARLFVSCANARMLVLDAASGKTLADLPIGKGTDSAAFDPIRKLAFSANGDGTLSVIAERDANTFVSLGDIKTPPGARTMAIDPETGRIFLVAADVTGTEPATEPGHAPHNIYAPGSAKLVILRPAK